MIIVSLSHVAKWKLTFSCNLQIDNSKPSSNSSIDNSLLQNGTLAIQVQKTDTGSGVNYVDIYQMTGRPIGIVCT